MTDAPPSDPPPFDPRPLVLEGRHVWLEPLAPRHLDELLVAGADRELFRWMPTVDFSKRDSAAAWIDAAVAEMEAGDGVVFATCVRRDDGPPLAVGSTRFFDLRREHRALEIGWTWIGTPWQRSAVNTEAKRLMLACAFERWGARRVQLKTDSRNVRSRAAMERVGASFEGILRHHVVLPDGSPRDSAFYSILAGEWPGVRDRLDAFLGRR